MRPPNEQQFSDVLESIFEMVREVTSKSAVDGGFFFSPKLLFLSMVFRKLLDY